MVVTDYTSLHHRCVTYLQYRDVAGVGEPQCVIVLTETEFVAVDLTTDGWPLHRLPYLHSLSTWSPVTCVQHVAGVTDAVWSNLVAAGSTEVGHWSMKVCFNFDVSK